MATPRPNRNYPSSMAVLYATCRQIWKSYLLNLAAFAAYLTTYVQQVGDDALAAIDAAEALPEDQARSEEAELLHAAVKNKGKVALMAWRYLERYIRKCFPEEEQKARLEAAGKLHYAEAANQNWPELMEMMQAGQLFLNTHGAAMVALGVPAGFAASYSAKRVELRETYDAFKEAEQNGPEGTDAKVDANNEIYAMTQDLCEDGQLVFWEDGAKRERFVYSHVQNLVSNPLGPNAMVVNGKVTIAADGTPLEGVKVRAEADFLEGPEGVVTDANGEYEMEVSGGTMGTPVKLTFEKPGLTTELLTVDYERGTVTVDMAMEEGGN